MPKLTKNFVNSIPHPERGQIIFRDNLLPGFGLRVTPGSKTYAVEARVHGVARRITNGKDVVRPWMNGFTARFSCWHNFRESVIPGRMYRTLVIYFGVSAIT